MTLSQKWRIWMPIVSGFSIAYFCKIPANEGALLPQRPPSYVFKFIWPILYIMLGLSWQKDSLNQFGDLMHSTCVFLLCLWIIIYQCQNQKKLGVYIIACTIAVVATCISLHSKPEGKLLLTPLLAWLLIAFQLNWNLIK